MFELKRTQNTNEYDKVNKQQSICSNGPTGWAKKVIPLVQFQNTQTLTVNKLNIQR